MALAVAGLIGVTVASFVPQPAHATAGINQQLNYQGRLLTNTGALVADGNYNMEFKIYTGGTGCVSSGSSPCGGTNVWTEDWYNSASNGVTVRNGYFSVSLGAITSLSGVDFNNDTLWLSTNIGGTSTGSVTLDGEMLPFKRLSSSPYAFNAGQLGGLSSSAYAQLAAANTFTAANLFTPGASAVVGLTVKASTAGTANSLEVFDASNVRQAYFDATGRLNVAQNILPTTNNAVSIGTASLVFQSVFASAVDASTSTTLTLGGASNAVAIGSTGHNVTIGSTSLTGSTTLIQGGTSSTAVQITAGSGGTISVGNGGVAGTIQIGNTTGAVAQTLNVGNNSTSGSTTTLVVGSTTSGSTTTINGAVTVTGSETHQGSGIKQTLNSTYYAPTVAGSISGVSGSLNGAHAVATAGKFAYVVSKVAKTFTTIDISNPSSPVVVGTLTDSSHLVDVKQMAINGKYAYLAGNGNSALEVIDISNPYSPSFVTELVDSTNLNGFKGIASSGRYVYGAVETAGKMVVIDVANPASPVIVGTGTTNVAGAKGIYVVGKYVYVASGNGGTKALSIYDVSTPSSPSYIGDVVDATKFAQAQSVYVSGRYAYIAGSSNTGYFVIVDISTPSAPTIVGSLTTADTANLQNIVVAGNYAYAMSNGAAKMVTIDISNPASPSQVNALSDATLFNSAQFMAINGRYAYAVSDASGASYFVAIDLKGNDFVTANIGAVSTNNLQVTEDAFVMNQLNVGGPLEVGSNASVSGNITVGGVINSLTGFSAGTSVGSSTTCSSGNVLQNPVIVGGIITSGTCATNGGGVAPTLQDAYNNSTNPALITETTGKPFAVRDFSTTTGNIFSVQNNAGTTNYFAVSNAGALTNSLDVVSGSTLNIGTSTATTINIGGSSTTTAFSGPITSTGNINLSGTYTSNNVAYLHATVQGTGQLNGIQNNNFFQPSGSSQDIYGLINNATLNGGSVAINSIIGASTQIADTSGYTGGTIPLGIGLRVAAPSIGTSAALFTETRGISISGVGSGANNNTGNTSGTITNIGLNVATISSADGGAGATMNNYGISLNVPTGSSGGGTTNNRGLFIQGGSASANNYAIYNSSAAFNYLAGNVGIGTSSGSNALNVTGTGSFSTSVLTPSIDVISAGTLSLGASTATTIQLGNPSLSSGTQTINIGNSNTSGGTQNITIGTGASATGGTTTLQGKTAVNVGNATTPTVSIQGGSGGTIGVGDNAVANTVNLGSSNFAGTQTFNIGANGNASGISAVTIGGLNSSSSTTIQGGTGNIVLNAPTVKVGTTGTSSGQFYVSGNMPTSTLSSTTLANALHVAVAGRYAYAMTQFFGSTLQVYDVTRPSAPVALGSVSMGASTDQMVVQGHYVYAASSGATALKIIDVSNPNSPSVSSSLTLGSTAVNSIAVAGRYAYLVGGSSLYIVDISNPASPTIAGNVTIASGMKGIAVNGKYAYMGNYTNFKVYVYDISNPASPSSVGNVTTSSHDVQYITMQGSYVYATSYTSHFVDIVKVTNPASPSVAGSVSTGTTNAASGIVSGHYFYVGTDVGLKSIDITNPASPSVVGTYTGSNEFSDIAINGEYLYASSYGGGKFYTMDLGGTYTQQLQAGNAELSGLQVNNDATFAGNATIQGGLQIGQSLQVGSDLGVTGSVAANTSVLSPIFDTPSAGTLTIGGTNATTINIANNAAAHTIAIGTGAAVQGITIGSTNSTSATTIQAGSGGIALTGNTSTSASSSFSLGRGSATAFQSLSNSGSNQLFTIDNSSGGDRVTVGNTGACSGSVGQGKLCVSQNQSSGSGTSVGQNITAITSSSASGGTIYGNVIYLNNTSGNANTLQGIFVDGSGTVAATDTFRGIQATAKAASQAGYLLQLNAATSTPVFTVGNTGATTLQTATNSQNALSIVDSGGTNTVFNVDTINRKVGVNTSAPSGVFEVQGGNSLAALSTSGSGLRVAAATYNDSGTGSGGTVTTGVANSFGIPTFTSTNTSVTYTNGATLYVAGPPTAGTNVTITNPYALYVSSGASVFGGNVSTSGGFTTTSTSGFTATSSAVQSALSLQATAPVVSTTASLIRIGSVLASGNSGGTFLSVNSSSGFAGDFMNLEVNGSSVYKVDYQGNQTLIGYSNATNGFKVNGTAGSTISACTSGQFLGSQAVAGGLVTAGTCTSDTLQTVYNNSTSPATILLADAKNFVINAADTSTDPNILFNLQCVTSCSTNGRFAVQNAGTDVFQVNPNGTIVIGSGSNNVTFASTGEPTLNGTAQHIRRIRLAAEYPNSVLDTGATGNNTGTMTSGLDLTNRMNYYKWTTASGSSQSYDIVAQIPLPSDFASWNGNTSINFTNWSSTTTANTIKLELRDTGGTVATNYNLIDVTPGSTSTWTTWTSSSSITGTYTAGGYITVRIRLTSPTSGEIRAGNITLDYLSKW